MCEWRPDFEAMDKRVDDIDTRLTRVETSLVDIREENKRGREDNQRGFDEIKQQLNNLYAERAEWGKTAREIVRKVVTWLMWLIPSLVGLRYAAEKIFFGGN